MRHAYLLVYLAIGCGSSPARLAGTAAPTPNRCEDVLVERTSGREPVPRSICMRCEDETSTCVVSAGGKEIARLDHQYGWRLRSLELFAPGVWLVEHDEGECAPMYLPVCFDGDADAIVGASRSVLGACSAVRAIEATDEALVIELETPPSPYELPVRFGLDPTSCQAVPLAPAAE